jgi:hypothetical protein
MSEVTKTQGALLNEYMVAKDDMQPEALAAALKESAAALMQEVDKKRVNKWLIDKEAIPHLLITAVKNALGLDGNQTYELRQAATNLKTQLEAKAQTASTGAAPVTEIVEPAAEPVAGVVTGSLHASEATVEMSDEDLTAKRFAAGKALRDLIAATPLSSAEVKRRSGNGDGDKPREVKVQHVMVMDLEERLKGEKNKTLRLSKTDLRQRMNNDDAPPHVRISDAEAAAIVSALEQSVEGTDRDFNKAVNAFSKAVAAAQPAWEQHEAQETARHAKAAAAAAARAAERKGRG